MTIYCNTICSKYTLPLIYCDNVQLRFFGQCLRLFRILELVQLYIVIKSGLKLLERYLIMETNTALGDFIFSIKLSIRPNSKLNAKIRL